MIDSLTRTTLSSEQKFSKGRGARQTTDKLETVHSTSASSCHPPKVITINWLNAYLFWSLSVYLHIYILIPNIAKYLA